MSKLLQKVICQTLLVMKLISLDLTSGKLGANSVIQTIPKKFLLNIIIRALKS